MGWLGVDIGGTKVCLRLESSSDSGEVREVRADWPEAGDVEADLALLRELLASTLADPEVGDVAAVGVAMPGIVAPGGALVAWPSRPSWVGLDLGSVLRDMVPGIPVGWADDGDLGALAEARHAGCDDLVYLGVGTGVGGGVVVGGQVLPGLDRGSCELGHLVVDLDGPRCRCGRHGCVQAFASGPAILARAEAERGAPTTPDDLREAWLAGADWAVTALDAGALALAAAVVGVGELLHPRVALIGGGFAAAHDGFVERIAGHVDRLTRPGQQSISVRPAALGGLSSLQGAVHLARSLT